MRSAAVSKITFSARLILTRFSHPRQEQQAFRTQDLTFRRWTMRPAVLHFASNPPFRAKPIGTRIGLVAIHLGR